MKNIEYDLEVVKEFEEASFNYSLELTLVKHYTKNRNALCGYDGDLYFQRFKIENAVFNYISADESLSIVGFEDLPLIKSHLGYNNE